nr:MAG TPA: hypothetical protein [Caudoviricetes sp.]
MFKKNISPSCNLSQSLEGDIRINFYLIDTSIARKGRVRNWMKSSSRNRRKISKRCTTESIPKV